ncbi:MAG: DUF3604 domain-containing protein, partial [Vulcanimicrobiaceae bacterium]
GAEDRGRGRECVWDGRATLEGNSWHDVVPINRYNIDKTFGVEGESVVAWQAITTGGFGGFEARLDHPSTGTLSLVTPHVTATVPVSEIGRDDVVLEAGGLGRRVRLFRLPNENPHRALRLTRTLPLANDRDNAFYIRVTFEDGHVAWSSPVYVFC